MGIGAVVQQPQQIGMLFIMTQQVQPAFIMPHMQSQHAWIIAQQALSPLVQVMQQPSSVISHLHMPIIRLQQHAIMPFIIMQQEHMPPAIIVQRLWIMPTAILSSVEQYIFMPPSHFSIRTMQRGTIIMFDVPGIIDGLVIAPPVIPGIPIPIPGMPIPVRSIIIALFIGVLLSLEPSGRECPSTGLDHEGDDNPDRLRFKSLIP